MAKSPLPKSQNQSLKDNYPETDELKTPPSSEKTPTPQQKTPVAKRSKTQRLFDAIEKDSVSPITLKKTITTPSKSASKTESRTRTDTQSKSSKTDSPRSKSATLIKTSLASTSATARSASQQRTKTLSNQNRIPNATSKIKTSAKKSSIAEGNEMCGVEAELAVEQPPTKIATKGDFIELNTKRYRLLSDIKADYGQCQMTEIDGRSTLMFYYEWYECKCKRIQLEADVLLCAKNSKRNHIMRLIGQGKDDNKRIRYMATEIYGPSLCDIRKLLPSKKFSLSTSLKLSFITLECIEELHKLGFIHRDIKPSVFIASSDIHANKIYLTHFGLARRYRAYDRSHVPQRSEVPCLGSLRYMSRSSHRQLERSRKDDVESWLYMVCEFFDARVLSWAKESRYAEVYRMKQIFMSDAGFKRVLEACSGLPRPTATIARLLNIFKYDTTPDYKFFKGVFRNSIIQGNFKGDKLDWLKKEDNDKKKVDKALQEKSAETAREGYFEGTKVDKCKVKSSTDDIINRNSRAENKETTAQSRSMRSAHDNQISLKSSKNASPSSESRSSSMKKKKATAANSNANANRISVANVIAPKTAYIKLVGTNKSLPQSATSVPRTPKKQLKNKTQSDECTKVPQKCDKSHSVESKPQTPKSSGKDTAALRDIPSKFSRKKTAMSPNKVTNKSLPQSATSVPRTLQNQLKNKTQSDECTKVPQKCDKSHTAESKPQTPKSSGQDTAPLRDIPSKFSRKKSAMSPNKVTNKSLPQSATSVPRTLQNQLKNKTQSDECTKVPQKCDKSHTAESKPQTPKSSGKDTAALRDIPSKFSRKKSAMSPNKVTNKSLPQSATSVPRTLQNQLKNKTQSDECTKVPQKCDKSHTAESKPQTPKSSGQDTAPLRDIPSKFSRKKSAMSPNKVTNKSLPQSATSVPRTPKNQLKNKTQSDECTKVPQKCDKSHTAESESQTPKSSSKDTAPLRNVPIKFSRKVTKRNEATTSSNDQLKSAVNVTKGSKMDE